MADGGLAVAIVEREQVGGECSYWGCIPRKALCDRATCSLPPGGCPVLAEAVTGAIDVEAAFAWRDSMAGHWDDTGQGAVAASRASSSYGAGRLAGERVRRGRGRPTVRSWPSTAVRRWCWRPGPALIPPIPGWRAAPWDNRGVTAAKELPRRLLVLGGGAIGAEMARLSAGWLRRRSPSSRGPRLLVREEPFAGEEVRASFEAEGITVITGVAMASRAPRRGGPVTATLADGRIEADEILVAVGRRPNTADLGLETVGLTPGRRRGRRLAARDRRRRRVALRRR